MYSKSALIFSALFLLVQGITSQCIGAYDGLGYGAPWSAAPIAAPCAPPLATPCAAVSPPCPWTGYASASYPSCSGGGFTTASSSPFIPAGVSVLSDNAYEGALSVGGALPFLGTVALEGALPSAGVGAVAYGCGNGIVAITAEDIRAATSSSIGIGGPLAYGAGCAGSISYGPAPATFGYGSGCGCGSIYY